MRTNGARVAVPRFIRTLTVENVRDMVCLSSQVPVVSVNVLCCLFIDAGGAPLT